MAVLSNNKLDDYGKTISYCHDCAGITIPGHKYTPTNLECPIACICTHACLYEWEVLPWALGYTSSSTCCGTTTNVYTFCDVTICDPLVTLYDKPLS